MNKAALYRKVNKITRTNAKELLEKFASVLKWRKDGRDSVLDVGCGPGDITLELLLPILPSNFERLVGIDISKNMLDYARELNVHPKVSFEQFNLEVELEQQSLNGIEPFDHILSFYCLMWVQNQKTCLQTLYKFLKSDGDMLAVLVANTPVYDVYLDQSQDERWAAYMTDAEKIVSPYHKSEDPEKEFRDLLIDSGFKDCDVSLQSRIFLHESFDKMKDFYHSINPFVDRFPAECRQEYLDDLMKHLGKKHSQDSKGCFVMQYQVIVVYAKK